MNKLRSSSGAAAGSEDFILSPESAADQTTPRDRPPSSFKPDRPEVMNPPGLGPSHEIDRGVLFECLVGAHNQARNLATGIITVEPGAELRYHRCSTLSLTLLRGSAIVQIEGRAYPLEPLDNVVIPRGMWHSMKNTSASEPSLLHIALPTSFPADELRRRAFAERLVPVHWRGRASERFNRFTTGRRFQAAPNATFIDFFNEELVPGIKMSGGYGLFGPGGRLPAHVHDFDESICIIQGVATCIVEGRTYMMANNSTALQPRGRVHYFINHSSAAMAMIWVYAGPKPQRLVVNERCATAEGNPWK